MGAAVSGASSKNGDRKDSSSCTQQRSDKVMYSSEIVEQQTANRNKEYFHLSKKKANEDLSAPRKDGDKSSGSSLQSRIPAQDPARYFYFYLRSPL